MAQPIEVQVEIKQPYPDQSKKFSTNRGTNKTIGEQARSINQIIKVPEDYQKVQGISNSPVGESNRSKDEQNTNRLKPDLSDNSWTDPVEQLMQRSGQPFWKLGGHSSLPSPSL